MYELETINDELVNPLNISHNRDLPRSNLFIEPNPFIMLIGKKKSGKTQSISKIVRKLITHYPLQLIPKQTLLVDNCGIVDSDIGCNNIQDGDVYERKITFFIFSGSVNNDPAWENIVEMIEDAGCKVCIKDSTYSKQGRNLIEDLTTRLKRITANEYVPPEDPREELVDKLMKPVHGEGDNCIIIDDLASHLKKNKSIDDLIKNMRHYRIKHFILSTQNGKNPTHDQYDNADNLILFRKIQPNRLRHIYDLASLGISFDEFVDMYNQATDKRHSFFMVDKNNDKYYKNFNKRFKV